MVFDPRHILMAISRSFGGSGEKRRPLTRDTAPGPDITFARGSQPRFWSDIDPRFDPRLRGAGDQVKRQFVQAPVKQGPQRQWWSDQGSLYNVQPRLDMAHDFEQSMHGPRWSPSQPTVGGKGARYQ